MVFFLGSRLGDIFKAVNYLHNYGTKSKDTLYLENVKENKIF